MPYIPLPPVSIPEPDCRRLDDVVRQAAADRHPVAAFLACELSRASVLPADDFPADTVALDRWVTFRSDRNWRPERRLLVCPQDYQLAELHLSVLSPLGAALIGLRVGSEIPYRSIEGVRHLATVESLGAPRSSKPEERSIAMNRKELPPITLTRSDCDRLDRLASAATSSPTSDFLAREVARATVVPSDTAPRDVVAMASKVTFRDDTTGQDRTIALVYPDEADVAQGRISILTPVGAALIGLSVGQSIEWQTPDGGWRSLTVLRVE